MTSCPIFNSENNCLRTLMLIQLKPLSLPAGLETQWLYFSPELSVLGQ